MKKKFPPLPNLDTIDIRLLRVFAAVVRNQGFSAAQMELNVNQPTISAHMSQLEVRLGLHLCHRGRSGFKLTKDGEQVYEATQALFNAIETFKTDVGGLRGQLVGEVHVGMVDAVVTNPDFKLSAAIKKFNQQAPEVKLHLHIKAPNVLQRNIQEEKLHFAITSIYRPSDINHEIPLFEESQTLYCALGHELFNVPKSQISMQMLEALPFAARNNIDNSASSETKNFNRMSISEDMECIATLILSGQYIGYLPHHYARHWQKKGLMKPLLEEELSYRSEFFLCYKKSRLNLATELFRKLVLTEYGIND